MSPAELNVLIHDVLEADTIQARRWAACEKRVREILDSQYDSLDRSTSPEELKVWCRELPYLHCGFQWLRHVRQHGQTSRYQLDESKLQYHFEVCPGWLLQDGRVSEMIASLSRSSPAVDLDGADSALLPSVTPMDGSAGVVSHENETSDMVAPTNVRPGSAVLPPTHETTTVADVLLQLDRHCESMQVKWANSERLFSAAVQANQRFCARIREMVSESQSDLLF